MTNTGKYRLDRRSLLRQSGAGLGAMFVAGCKFTPTPGFAADILVLGAGLSGLHAARVLEAAGRDVLVLEGAARIGGRLQTLRHQDGHTTEAGGEQVGANYARILDTATALGVPMSVDTPTPRGTTYHYKGKLYGPEDWASFADHPFTEPFKGLTPAAPLFALAGKNNPLVNAMDWRDAAAQRFDISAGTFLHSKGLTEPALDVIGHALNGNHLNSYSMMNLYRSLQIYTQSRDMGPSRSFDEGAEALPKAMALSLSRPVATETMIAKIATTQEAVIVTTRTGKTYKARHCICTLPFGALRHVEIDAPITSVQKSAINTLPYTQILQIHFKLQAPYWDVDDFPADMWMDGPMERIFVSRDKAGGISPYGRAWINGESARTLAAQPDEFVTEMLKQELFRSRQVKPSDIEVLAIKRWTSGNVLAGGAYMHWAPGQISKWADIMGRSTGNLSFAGEHLSALHTGMEGAMESGENSALSFLEG